MRTFPEKGAGFYNRLARDSMYSDMGFETLDLRSCALKLCELIMIIIIIIVAQIITYTQMCMYIYIYIYT